MIINGVIINQLRKNDHYVQETKNIKIYITV